MPQRRLLFLDINGLSAYRWQDGLLTPEGSFKPDAAGQEAFAAYLPSHRKSLFYLLAEVVDEGYQADVIPHVQGSDRAALLKRKIDQYFYGTSLSLAFTIGREETGRRDDRILFLALTRPQFFEPWLAGLRDAECLLAGVFSLPLIANTFTSLRARKVVSQPQRLLLVTLTRGGLRQSYLDSGQLRFSRLTPLAVDTPEEIASACAVETTRIHQYLIGQRLLDRGVVLPTLILTHPAETAIFREHCPDTNELSFEFIDLLAEARRLGLKTLPQDSRCDSLFLHLMARNTPRQQFAESSERRLFRLWQTRLGLNSAGLIILLSCLIFSSKQLIQLYQLGEATEQVQQQAEAAQQQYTSALKTLPTMPFSSTALRALIGRYDQLVKNSATLEPMYQRISAALAQATRVELIRLDWRIDNNPDEGAQAPGAAKQSARVNSAGELFVLVDVYAQLPAALKNDERTLKTIIDEFSSALSKDGKVQVRILKLPFEVESTKSLKSTDESSAVVEAPKFSLRISQKL